VKISRLASSIGANSYSDCCADMRWGRAGNNDCYQLFAEDKKECTTVSISLWHTNATTEIEVTSSMAYKTCPEVEALDPKSTPIASSQYCLISSGSNLHARWYRALDTILSFRPSNSPRQSVIHHHLHFPLTLASTS
jgi:hypothetical protein